MGCCQSYADRKNLDFRTSDRYQGGFFSGFFTADTTIDFSPNRILFLKEDTSLQRLRADHVRCSIWTNNTAKSPPPQVEFSDVNTLGPLSKLHSQLAPHQIPLKKTWCANSTSCGPAIHNSINVSRLSLSPSILSLQETSGRFLHHQISSSCGNEMLSPSPEHLIAQHNRPLQTHLSTKATTTPRNENPGNK